MGRQTWIELVKNKHIREGLLSQPRRRHGGRYALVGLNGGGKSSLLTALAARRLPVPSDVVQ
jgi:hypothetical protein